jgi:hypothetical protein
MILAVLGILGLYLILGEKAKNKSDPFSVWGYIELFAKGIDFIYYRGKIADTNMVIPV